MDRGLGSRDVDHQCAECDLGVGANINTTAYHPLSSYWPGAGHVGMCGIDGYLSSGTSTWSNTIAPSVSALESTCGGKPWDLTETGLTTPIRTPCRR